MEELVEKAKVGDKEAYTKLVTEVKKDLYFVARNNIKEEADVEDVIQDTTMIGYMKINQLRDNSSFRAWIIKILKNECRKFYKNRQRDEEINNKYINNKDKVEADDFDDKLEFDNIIKDLNDTDKEIMKLYYEDNLSSEQISRLLGINDNTIKSKINRSKKKISMSYKKVLMTILICCIVTTGAVFGKDIINYLKDIFSLSSVDQSNDGILNAIEDKDWIQNIDMEYIELAPGYKIRVDYLLMDDINMYMVFDLQCDEEQTEYNRMSIQDINIKDQQGNIIHSIKENVLTSISKLRGWKSLESNSNKSIRELKYMISDGYPTIDRLDITFSEITLYNDKDSNQKNKIITGDKVNISIYIEDKFINRNVVEYVQEDLDDKFNIHKAIITDTGFYAIVESTENKIDFDLKCNNKKYKCNYRFLKMDYNEEIKYYHLILADIDLNDANRELVLNSEDKVIKLNKK